MEIDTEKIALITTGLSTVAYIASEVIGANKNWKSNTLAQVLLIVLRALIKRPTPKGR